MSFVIGIVRFIFYAESGVDFGSARWKKENS